MTSYTYDIKNENLHWVKSAKNREGGGDVEKHYKHAWFHLPMAIIESSTSQSSKDQKIRRYAHFINIKQSLYLLLLPVSSEVSGSRGNQ